MAKEIAKTILDNREKHFSPEEKELIKSLIDQSETPYQFMVSLLLAFR